jgi:hypothetical protein
MPDTMPAPPPPPSAVISNVWLVTCHGCGSYDIAGPGHPAVRPKADGHDGQFEFYDRDALRLKHDADCVKDPVSGYSLDFSIMAAPPAMTRAGG